jgi:GntR family transcriptional regulator
MPLARQQPLYLQLIDAYRQQIAAGRLQGGDALPSVRGMASQHAISVATAARVLKGLRALGLATMRPGTGTFVVKYPGTQPDAPVSLTRDMLRETGAGTGAGAAGRGSEQPRYVQVIESYRKQIAAGRFRDGDTLPSVREISAVNGISRATAEKVREGLHALGLARRQPGAGTFAAIHPDALAGTGGPLTAQSVRDRRRRSASAVTVAVVARPPRRITSQLRLPPDTAAIRRTRTTRRAGKTTVVTITWYPADLGETIPQLLTPAPLPARLPGFNPVTEEAHIITREATQAEREALGARRGKPIVLSLRRRLYDSGGQVIAYTEQRARKGEEITVSLSWEPGRPAAVDVLLARPANSGP